MERWMSDIHGMLPWLVCSNYIPSAETSCNSLTPSSKPAGGMSAPLNIMHVMVAITIPT
jgi:hypothetical protein